MAKITPFERYLHEYEVWFDHHPHIYQAEIRALKRMALENGPSLEIGVGSGRFAAPLGVTFGVDPSSRMASLAHNRGIHVALGVAEHLPFVSNAFRWNLIVTTICFVDDARATLREAHRVLQPDGKLVIGLVDRESPIGQEYLAHQRENVFYREATFYSAEEIHTMLVESGFQHIRALQTLFGPLDSIAEKEPIREGWGAGSFVVFSGKKPTQ